MKEKTRNYLLEVCCGSAEDAIQAARGGADRAELCSNLFQGGLTPTLGAFETVRAHCDIRINVMIRPRQGGFCYTESEFQTAMFDLAHFVAAGADGLVCGFLKEDGRVDRERTLRFVEAAKGLPVTFHRAVDVVPDWREAFDTLAECGVARVLTSGQAPSVYYALDTVSAMIAYAGERFIVMPGAGITLKNAAEVQSRTRAREMHVAFMKTAYDRSAQNKADIYFGGALYPPEDRYNVIDAEKIAALL